MAKRLHQTMADYVVIAISPALIMTLVGSLVFFLLAVLYQGQFAARLHWVMACFVFAAVLIGRISIEEGMERAMMFGIALAIPVGIAANRFIEIHGTPVDSFAWLINWALIGLIWWCAHRLTWDCTVIDDAEDASGEGLLQVVGFEKPKSDADREADARRLEGTTTRAVPAGWWQRYVDKQKRPHAPGVWVVYFSLAALPLFGLGQWFIPAENLGTRRYAFWLLGLYVASGMGLLLTTSFLGLRRYLRQRRIEMPTLMANLWLGTGAVIIVALLVFAALLPRPSAEYAVSELPFTVGSPSQQASRIAPVQKEGAEDEQPGSAAQSPQQPEATDNNSPDGDPQPDTSSTPPNESGDSTGNQSQDRTPPADSQGQGQPTSDQGSSSSKQGSDGKSASGNSQQDKSGAGKSGQGKSGDGKSGDGKSGQSSSSQSKNGQNRSDNSKQEAPKSGEKKSDFQRGAEYLKSRAQPKPQADKDSASDKQSDRSAKNDSGKKDSDQQSSENRSENQPASPPNPPASAPSPAGPLEMLGGLSNALKWVFYAVLAVVVAILMWRSRAELLAMLREFLALLQNLFGGLLGGESKRAPKVGSEPPADLPPPPFSTFADPFATGIAGRYSGTELVSYTFEAFEAWSREHGCPREPDTTPHELARDVGRLNAFIATEARNIAELHARAAYATGELPPNTATLLAALWQKMRAHDTAAL